MALFDSPAVDAKTLLGRTLAGIVLGLVVNLTILTVVLSVDLVGEHEALAYGPVSTFSSLGVVGAAVVYAGLDRVSENHDRLFTAIAVVVLLGSFVPDLVIYQSDEAATLGVVSVLMGLHVPPALAAIVSLTGRLDSWLG